MNILFEPFPETVIVHGKDYAIVTDFREWIKLHELFESTERFTIQTLNMVLEWYEEKQPEDKAQAVRALQDFMLAGEIYNILNDEDGEQEAYQNPPKKPSFSFSQDATCIYSAFREVYGIDITNIPYMHWWQFLVLFEGLPAGTEIKERIYYRTVDLNTIESKEERKRIKRIKKRIALKEPRKRKVDDYEIGDMFA